MGDSRVLELQRLAQSGETSVIELLRRAKVLAVQLDIQDARTWIDHEIDGYPTLEVPDYRVVPAELRAYNRLRGWETVQWDVANPLQEFLSRAPIAHPISQVEVFAKGSSLQQANLSQRELDLLAQFGNSHLGQLKLARFYARNEFVRIIEAVRNKILDWALQVERQGVAHSAGIVTSAPVADTAQSAKKAPGSGGDADSSFKAPSNTSDLPHPSVNTSSGHPLSPFLSSIRDLANAPLRFLPAAMQAVPAVKYVLGLLAIAGSVAVAMSYFKSPTFALVALLAGFALMGLLVVFAKAVKLKGGHAIQATIFIWICLLLFVIWSLGMTTSVFIGWPLKIDILRPQAGPSTQPNSDHP